MAAQTNTVRVELVGKDRNVGSTFKKAGTDAKTFHGHLKNVDKQLKSLGINVGRVRKAVETMGFAMAGAALMGSVQIVRMTVSFESSMKKIESLAGASAKEVAGFSEAILDMAGKVGRSPKDLADSLYFIRSAGLKGGCAGCPAGILGGCGYRPRRHQGHRRRRDECPERLRGQEPHRLARRGRHDRLRPRRQDGFGSLRLRTIRRPADRRRDEGLV